MIERWPAAIWLPGPVNKTGYGNVTRTDKRGEIKHSMEGGFEAAMNVLANVAVQVSWHFSTRKNGLVYQHYEQTEICWHGGDKPQNLLYIGNEHEGKAGEPLTEAQISSTTALTRWLADTNGLPLIVRYPDQIGGWELTEHREVHPTACPSGRIPWPEILRRLQETGQEEDEMIFEPRIVNQPGTVRNHLDDGVRLIFIRTPDEEADVRAYYGLGNSAIRQVSPEWWEQLIKARKVLE